MLTPISVSLAVTTILRLLLPAPNAPSRIAWTGGILVIAVVTAVGVERLARHVLPLVTLLKLSMLFPDQAPSRFSVARAAGRDRKLAGQVRTPEPGRGPQCAQGWVCVAQPQSLCAGRARQRRRNHRPPETERGLPQLP